MQHIEFFDKRHFENRYHRVWATAPLSLFIDFFWETDFASLWPLHPDGFSDVLFPNTGYTYLLNLGTPCTMQVGENKFEMRTDGFLPRHKSIECYHSAGNQLFGIKFRVSPVIFQKKINFLEYREQIFPLSYLLEQPIIDAVKKASSFAERVGLLSNYYISLIEKYKGSLRPIEIVTSVLESVFSTNDFYTSINTWAEKNGVSERTLQRYFEASTSISTKQALQIMRIRKAVANIANSPHTFSYKAYGYYDYSHFYKHLKSFLQKTTLQHLRPHLQLLKEIKTGSKTVKT